MCCVCVFFFLHPITDFKFRPNQFCFLSKLFGGGLSGKPSHTHYDGGAGWGFDLGVEDTPTEIALYEPGGISSFSCDVEH